MCLSRMRPLLKVECSPFILVLGGVLLTYGIRVILNFIMNTDDINW